VLGLGSSAYAIANASAGERGLVTAQKTGGFLGGMADGVAATGAVGGLALGAAAIGLSVGAPVVLLGGAVVGFAGALYASGLGRNAGEYYYKLGWQQ
jgi:hypothetical protein